MRAGHVVVAVLFLLGFGVKSFIVMAVEAASRAKGSVTLDVSQMHRDANNLPVEEFHDMSLAFPVFSSDDWFEGIFRPGLFRHDRFEGKMVSWRY